MRDLLRTERYIELRRILKEARLALNLDQEELGARIGRPQTYVSDVETAIRRVDSVEFLRLAKALELDPLEVMANVMEIEDAP